MEKIINIIMNHTGNKTKNHDKVIILNNFNTINIIPNILKKPKFKFLIILFILSIKLNFSYYK